MQFYEINYDNVRQIEEEDFIETNKRTKLESEDILIANTGHTIGKMLFVKESEFVKRTTFQKSVAIVKPNKEIVNSSFLYYVLFACKERLRKTAVGSAQPNLLLSDMRDFELEIEDNIYIQRQIARKLSVLDDKIELNNKINSELEALAKTFYDYWFVQFDFPNEGGKPYKSSGGAMEWNEELKREIPIEWEVKEISKLIDVKDGTHDSPKQSEEGRYLITSKHLTKAGIDFKSAYLISNEDYVQVNKRSQVEKDDILISMIGTIGLRYFVQEDNIEFAIKNIGLYKTSQNKEIANLLYLYISSFYGENYFKTNTSGSIQNYLTLGVLRTMPFLLPPKRILKSFDEVIKPIFEKNNRINIENQELSSLRDWLLPMLMNGQVSVE